MAQTAKEKELINCPDCRVVDSQQESDPRYDGRFFIDVRSGMTLGISGIGHIDLWTTILLCDKHEKVDLNDR